MKQFCLHAILICSLATTHAAFAFDLDGCLEHISSWLQSFSNSAASEVAVASPASNNKYTLSARQVEGYLNTYFATLEYGLSPAATYTDINAIRALAVKKAEADRSIYIWVSGVRFFDKDKIDQYNLEGLIEYVENKSYSLAYDQTFDITIAKKVSRSIKGSLQTIINKTSYLDYEQIKPFFGAALSHQVRQRINQIDVPYQPIYTPQPPVIHQQLYTSSTCCSCMEPFGGATTQRVYLKPCGHDICETCALNWFFPNDMPDKTRTCPQCRSSISFDALFNDLGL